MWCSHSQFKVVLSRSAGNQPEVQETLLKQRKERQKEEKGGECAHRLPRRLAEKTNVTVLTTNNIECHETIVPQPVQALGFTISRIRKLRLPGAFTKRAKESREQIGSPWGYFYHLLTRMRGSNPKGMTTGSAPVSSPCSWQQPVMPERAICQI